MNEAYSTTNQERVASTEEYEEIIDGQTTITAGGETGMFNIAPNEAYQTRTEAAETIMCEEDFDIKANVSYETKVKARSWRHQ